MSEHYTIAVLRFMATLSDERQSAIKRHQHYVMSETVRFIPMLPFWARELRTLRDVYGVTLAGDELARRNRE